MEPISLTRLLDISADGSRCTRRPGMDAVDFERPFVHESLTPLYYTPLYATLDAAQRLRYNQLTAIKINEQFILLEELLVDIVLPALMRHRLVRSRPDLRRNLEVMREDEVLHKAMFVDLNRRCLPGGFTRSPYFFVRGVDGIRSVVRLCVRAPRNSTFLLWLLLLLEEYTVGLSRVMKRHDRSGSLGAIDETFRAVHAEHVKDEVRHVHIDCHLIDTFSAPGRGFWTRVNERILEACLATLSTPNAATRVVRRLTAEFPGLASRESEFAAALRVLGRNGNYQSSLFSRELTPVSFAMLDNSPVSARLQRILPAYVRGSRV